MFTVLHKWDNYNAHSMDLVAKYLYQYFDTQTTEKLCLLFNMLENNPSNDPNHSRFYFVYLLHFLNFFFFQLFNSCSISYFHTHALSYTLISPGTNFVHLYSSFFSYLFHLIFFTC
eukprot:Phypoly_transcript_13045.p1 GENE.Phypoly_transcript_13045~~Phypoly_transcript_13045.p1  ORF type:complete len:116 (-),score=7.57 Phypoly_transcript_13045:501-848(-)